MKNSKIYLSALVIILLSLLSSVESMAQCAMCRATVENNLSDGSTSIGAGLNTGILYLVSFPYLAFLVIAYFWYRSSKAHYAQRIKTSGYSGRRMS